MSKDSPRKPSFYETLKAMDIVDPIMEPYSKGQIRVDLKTKRFSIRRDVDLFRPWTFAAFDPDRNCGKWLSIYYMYYKILPPPCKQCWKVVYVPSSVVELIEFQKFQTQLGLPGKCGTEQRDYTSGLGGYRAFWYCPFYGGLEGGRAHYKRIKSALIKNFGEDYILNKEKTGRLYLKRGCTELERDFGMSDTWDSVDHSVKFRILESVWEDPDDMVSEFTPLIYTNYKRWIEFAIAHNDKSAAEYLHTDKFGVQSIKYHESDHKVEDFQPSIVSFNETDKDKNTGKSDDKTKENMLESLD